MKRGILEISRRAGDASLGETVVRLARMAAAAHESERARVAGASEGEKKECDGARDGGVEDGTSRRQGEVRTEVNL